MCKKDCPNEQMPNGNGKLLEHLTNEKPPKIKFLSFSFWFGFLIPLVLGCTYTSVAMRLADSTTIVEMQRNLLVYLLVLGGVFIRYRYIDKINFREHMGTAMRYGYEYSARYVSGDSGMGMFGNDDEDKI